MPGVIFSEEGKAVRLVSVIQMHLRLLTDLLVDEARRDAVGFRQLPVCLSFLRLSASATLARRVS